jgi:hypothetical protein
VLVLPAALAAMALAGCGSDEPTAAVAIAKSGLLGPIGEQLKREDDDNEAAELRETAPSSREEREEAHEQAEAAELAQEEEAAETPTQLVEASGEGETGATAGS